MMALGFVAGTVVGIVLILGLVYGALWLVFRGPDMRKERSAGPRMT